MIYFADKVLINQEQEKKLDDLLSPQLIQRKDSNKDYCLLLVGVERILPKDEKQKLLLNPINYTIKKGDIAYIIAQNREMANKAIQEFDENPSLSQKYYKTQELYEQDNYIQTSQNFIKELFEKLFLKKKNWEQNISSHPKDDIFDLNMGSSLRGCFKNHIIIKGSLTDFSNIIKIIRFYSDRPVIIFSELEIDFSIWLKIKEKFRNVYYVKGMQHSLNHINELDPQKAYKILVMSSQIRDFLFRDTDSIVFARILVDFFKIKRILIELVDESMVRFLEIRPKFDFISKNQDISFFWPSYVSGNLHYNSLLMSIAARSLYNSNWTLFLKELSVPKIYNEIQLNDENIIKENSNICMLKITKAIANSVIFYGRLQFLLMSNDPCIIALALLKKRKAHKSQIANELIGKLKGNKSYQEESMQKKLINTINSVYGTKFFLTNPVFYTRINEGDKILVLGNKNLTQKLNEKINILAKISIIKVIASPQKKKKKNTELPNSIEKIKKKKIENEIKGKMKENIGQMLKNINDAMKLSLVCYDLFSTLPDKDEVENS